MKKGIVLLFVSFMTVGVLYAQNESTLNLNVKSNSSRVAQMEQGIYLNEDGTMTVVKVGGSGFVSLKKLRKRVEDEMANYASERDLNYRFITETTRKTAPRVFPMVARQYKLLNTDGSDFITKEMAISNIKLYKNLLNDGVISQKEFNEATEKYKKIILKTNQ